MNRNDPEDRALFCELIAQALGETVSDLALLKDIHGRLMVSTITPTTTVPDLDNNNRST
jgi:hypothetical protein